MKNKIVIGFDIGTVKISWAIKKTDDGNIVFEGHKRHNGNLSEIRTVFLNLEQQLKAGGYAIASIVATGALSGLVIPEVKKIPEQAAQEEAAKLFYPELSSYNIVRLGGNGFSILTFSENKFAYQTNDKCSSGTGTAIERLCIGRFSLSVAEACAIAKEAKNPPKIAARCSVFIKSEITHLANQGLDRKEILASYFNGIAINISGLLKKRCVNGPFIFIGGVSQNEEISGRIKKFLQENGVLSENVKISGNAHNFEAHGAAGVALKLAYEKNSFDFALSEIIAPHENKTSILSPLQEFKGKVKRIENKNIILELEDMEFVLGLDLGSTGSKLAIILGNYKNAKKDGAMFGEVMYDDYTSTKGDPIMAAQELIKRIPEKFSRHIISVGITGSGRHTVATLLQAAFPGMDAKICVKTEIIAHAKSASKIDPDHGESLSVIEIGGQDAKYTLVKNGEVEDSIMNMACAAGTGSFLEEQGIFYNVDNILKFGEMAAKAQNPANLGQHCTVFVAELANKALQEGFLLEDIFAGFYYSVVYNYVNRVMGKRIFGKKIFLQGKPASNIALACAFAGVIGKDVIVPPNPGAMGAIGIALCALDEINPALTLPSEGREQYGRYFDLRKFLEARIISRSEFQCNNIKCGNLCRINMTVVKAGEEERRVMSGGMCPKYEQSKTYKLPQEAPNPFREREKLAKDIINKATAENEGEKTVGIPIGLGMVRYFPMMIEFFKSLDFGVKIIEHGNDTMEKGDSLCSSYDTCAPIKIMHGLFFDDTDYYFCPKIINLPKLKDEKGSCTCPLVQGAPNLLEFSVKNKKTHFLAPILDFSAGLGSDEIKNEFLKIAADLGKRDDAAKIAIERAIRAQKSFESELLKIGERALEYAAKNNFSVVLVCGRLYTIYNSTLASGIPQVIQDSGAIALPIDCYPVRKHISALEIMYWGEGQRNLKGVLDLFERDHIFPVWITNYICGPDSFLEHFFKNLCQNYPHMNLETDGHSGTAGFSTRIEAFLHTCRLHVQRDGEKHLPDISPFSLRHKGAKPINILGKDTLFILPSMGDVNQFFEGLCRSFDIDSISLPLVDRNSFTLGRKDCSGKECLPFLCLWGSIKEFIIKAAPEQLRKKMIFLVPTTDGPCRFCMYHIRIKQLTKELLDERGIKADIEFYSPTTGNSYEAGLGASFQLKLWISILVSDLLHDLLHYIRPIAVNPEDAEKVYEKYKSEFIKLLSESNTKSIFNTWGITALMEKAAKEFSLIPKDEKKKKRVIDITLAGEIYVRMENFANDDLIRKLEKYGFRVKLSSFREWFNYVSFCEKANLREKESEYARIMKKKIEKLLMRFYERKLYNICAKALGWPHDHEIRDIVKAGHPYLGDAPQGEAILTIGAPLLMHKQNEIKGAVIIGPYGCMPTKLAEAQLNRENLPFLAIFVDGEPIDENKLANFAWQLGGVDSLR